MANHTPGPWIVERRRDRFQLFGEVLRSGCTWREAVAKTNRTLDPQDEAGNARLLAAAPELLAVLEQCEEVLRTSRLHADIQAAIRKTREGAA